MIKVNKIKIAIAIVIVLFSILILPQFIVFLGYFKQYTIQAPTIFFQELNFINNISLIVKDKLFLKTWIYFQPAILLAIGLTLFAGKKRNKIRGDLGGPEAAGNGEYGTSKWLTEREVDSSTTPWVMELKDTNSKEVIPPMILKNPYSGSKEKVPAGGVVLGMKKEKQRAWLDTEDTNTLIIGTTRSRKTRSFIFPSVYSIAQGRESMILTDPKGEIYDLTHSYLRSIGYDLVLLDFRTANRGNFWNPINAVVKAINNEDTAKASETAWDIAHSLVYQSPDIKADVWADGQESVLASLILATAMETPDDKYKNMSTVYENLIELGKTEKVMMGKMLIDYIPLNEYFKSLDRNHIAKKAFGTASLSPERMRGSFFSNTAATIRLFSDPGISHITSKQDHDLKNIGRKPTAVFLVIPDEKTTRHILASLYLNQTYQALVELANECGGRLPLRVNYLLDEFGNMPSIPDFDTKVTVSLGRGIRWHLVVQDFQQLRKRYRENADTIKGNAHTWIYLLTTDLKTAEELSKKTGAYTIETKNYSSSEQSRGSSKGQTIGLTKRELLTPDEILRWQAEESLLLRARKHPARLPMPDISHYVYAYRDFTEAETVTTESRKIIAADTYILGGDKSKNGSIAGIDVDYEYEQHQEEEENTIF